MHCCWQSVHSPFAVILNEVKAPRVFGAAQVIDGACVYIMASSLQKLYIGMTTDLMLRVSQHKQNTNPECHTARCNINGLVYFERYALVLQAIRREKVLKGWLRRRKLELIITTNPLWKDLSEPWGEPSESFD